ncbi:MAG: hypothetical protein VX376_01220 [Pseudomonadota bacterium]|nr:hypothetical protein [Pseudomonadota bacterium]
MFTCKYSRKSISGDYIRAIIGLVITGGLLLAATKVTIFQYIFAAGALLFFGFLIRTFLRQFSSFVVTEQDLKRVGLFKRSLSWDQLNNVTLKYFSTRRDRKAGWYQLTLSDDIVKITIDSELMGFDTVMKTCADVVIQKRLTVSETTSENFASSGLSLMGSDQPHEETMGPVKDE